MIIETASNEWTFRSLGKFYRITVNPQTSRWTSISKQNLETGAFDPVEWDSLPEMVQWDIPRIADGTIWDKID